MIELLNCDCMEYMATVPDKYFDLACVDPPYGIKNMNAGGRGMNRWIDWEKKGWDDAAPDKKYFEELTRISKNQIIWGGNYFDLPPSKCWIIWDKGQRDFSLADGEMAWASFDKAMRIKTIHRAVANQENKIHPTQKPVALYQWLLTNYAKKGQKVFDSHGGSMSSVIAAINCGCSIVCCELDTDYFAAGVERVRRHQNQFTLFNDENVIVETKPITNDIFA